MPAYKKEKSWYCSFYYEDWTGKRKKKKKEGFDTKKAALQFEREFLEKSQASPDMTFGSLVELYLEDCKTRLKPTTYASKKYVIDLKVLPFFKDMPLDQIKTLTVRQWQNTLINDNYSQTYLKNIHNQLSSVLNFAVKYYNLSSNPARECGSIGSLKSDAKQFWTVDEFKQFIKYSDNPMYTTVYQILYWTGVRVGECLALTLNDFNFEAKTVTINKNYIRLNKQDLILEPKTSKSNRTITIPDFLIEVVKDYVDKLYAYDSSDRLFAISRETLTYPLKKISEKAGVKRIRIHDFRHSHASLLIEMGFAPLLISERLGHESIQTTLQTYSHLYPNKQSEVADKLNKLVRF